MTTALRSPYDAVAALAAAHGHGWAYEVPPLATREDWDAFSASRTAEMAAEEAALRASEDPWPYLGLCPALAHTTGTGRLSWSLWADPRPSVDAPPTLIVTVERPHRGLLGSCHVVARAAIRLGHDWPGSASWDVTVLGGPDGARLRHLVALIEAIHVAVGLDVESSDSIEDEAVVYAGDPDLGWTVVGEDRDAYAAALAVERLDGALVEPTS